MKLNIGCGTNKLEGYINIDRFAELEPDLVHTFGEIPLPYEANSVTEVILDEVLPHIGDFFFQVFVELHKLCVAGSPIKIILPEGSPIILTEAEGYKRLATVSGIPFYTTEGLYPFYIKNPHQLASLEALKGLQFTLTSSEIVENTGTFVLTVNKG